MEEVERKNNRGIIKEHALDFYCFFKRWFCFLLEKGTGNKCEDHKGATLLVGGVILYFVSTGVLFNLNLVPTLIREAQTDTPGSNLAAANATNLIKIESPTNSDIEKSQKCDLNSGPWNRWYGKVSQGVDDKNYFILPVNGGGFLFQYAGNIEDITTCELSFIPRGENAIGYVVSLDGIYQIVIGDNDYWTITLKATDQVDGDLIPIEESVTAKTRPRLLSKVREGTTMNVLLTQKFLENKKYEVTAEVSYKPDIDSTSEIRTEKFTWVFNPSPAIHNPVGLSVGLVRDPADTSEIGASFIVPSLNPKE